jgi:site-specific DNA-methyltransferase (adenine-specific)
MSDYKLMIGDCIEQMSTLPDESVNCCVTSPPYFGLRDYGHDGQIGLEPTPDDFVAKLVDVFRQVHRVLRDDGTLWLNLGDSYASFRDAKCTPNTVGGGQKSMPSKGATNRSAATFKNTAIKHKDLIGIPWRVAFALQEDGWYLRQDIIWHKPNPMPESVKDRCTKAHEYIFLLSKSPRYYFDNEAIKEHAVYAGIPQSFDTPYKNKGRGSGKKPSGNEKKGSKPVVYDKKNRRSVWKVTTKPYKGAHFATFPPDLIEPCILAGCPQGGTVLDPFGGSGTTAGVAIKHDRSAILCELNEEYAALTQERVQSIVGLQNLDLFND